MYPNVHCSTIARTWKQPRCPSTHEWIKKLWYIYTMEYYSAIKRNAFESVLMRWMNLKPIIQGEVNQKEKDKYCILTYIHGIYKDGTDEFIFRAATEKHREETYGRGGEMKKERVRCMERITWKHITICKTDSQWDCYMTQGTQTGAL